jgi:hypothetical protein
MELPPLGGATQFAREGDRLPHARSRAGDKGRLPAAGPCSPAVSLYLMWTPEIAREMTRRWISEVPSKIV